MRSERLVEGLSDAVAAGDLTLVRVSWWRAAAARLWWWVWPYGVLSVVAFGVVLARAAARGRFETSVWVFATIVPVGMVVLFVVYRRSRARYGAVLCRVAVPTRLVAFAKLRRRSEIEPRVLSTPVLFMPDGSGLGLGEGDGAVGLRELGVVLEVSCSRSGRIGWCTVRFDGAADRAPCAGRLGLAGRNDLFG